MRLIPFLIIKGANNLDSQAATVFQKNHLMKSLPQKPREDSKQETESINKTQPIKSWIKQQWSGTVWK